MVFLYVSKCIAKEYGGLLLLFAGSTQLQFKMQDPMPWHYQLKITLSGEDLTYLPGNVIAFLFFILYAG
jgi:hypothetical protein